MKITVKFSLKSFNILPNKPLTIFLNKKFPGQPTISNGFTSTLNCQGCVLERLQAAEPPETKKADQEERWGRGHTASPSLPHSPLSDGDGLPKERSGEGRQSHAKCLTITGKTQQKCFRKNRKCSSCQTIPLDSQKISLS